MPPYSFHITSFYKTEAFFSCKYFLQLLLGVKSDSCIYVINSTLLKLVCSEFPLASGSIDHSHPRLTYLRKFTPYMDFLQIATCDKAGNTRENVCFCWASDCRMLSPTDTLWLIYEIVNLKPNVNRRSAHLFLMKLANLFALTPQPTEDIFSRPGPSEEMDSLLFNASEYPDCSLRLCSLQKLKVCS